MAAITIQPVSEGEEARRRPVYDTSTRDNLLIRTIPGNVILPASYEKYKKKDCNFDMAKSVPLDKRFLIMEILY